MERFNGNGSRSRSEENRSAVRWDRSYRVGTDYDGGCEYGAAVESDSRPVTLRRAGSWSNAMTSQANDVLVPLTVGNRTLLIAPVDSVQTSIDVGRLPYTLRILLENVVRAAAL